MPDCLESTGITNSRSECQTDKHDTKPPFEFRTDWLTVTGKIHAVSDLHAMMDFVAGSFDDVVEWFPQKGITAGRYYANSAKSVRGILLAWSEESEGFDKDSTANKIVFRLSIPAQALRVLDEKECWRVFVALYYKWKCKSTRFDIACDDYSKSYFNYADTYAAGSCGNYTGFKQFQPVAIFEAGKLTSWSLYFGAPSSDKRLVMYNKAAESKGKIDSHRLEIRLKEQRAANTFAYYCSWGEDIEKASEIFAERVVGFLSAWLISGYDFVFRNSGDRASRCDRLDWWDKFLSQLKVIDISHLAPRRPTATLDSTLQWFQHQIAPTAALVRKVLGSVGYKCWWNSLLADGERRWSDRHKALIQVAQGEWSAEV